jgi:hypothetical protein
VVLLKQYEELSEREISKSSTVDNFIKRICFRSETKGYGDRQIAHMLVV